MANLDLKNQAVLKSILCVVLAGGLLGVFFFTHVVPFSFPNRSDQIKAHKADYEKKSTELARARASVADLPRFEAEYGQLHQRWSRASELLPADRQFAALLRKITLAGQQTGVQFVMFKPNGNRPETYYTEMPVEISVDGGYHQVGSFLAELANMHRIITVTSVSLQTNINADGGGTTRASMVASAYSLNATPGPVKEAGAPTSATNDTKGEADHVGKES